MHEMTKELPRAFSQALVVIDRRKRGKEKKGDSPYSSLDLTHSTFPEKKARKKLRVGVCLGGRPSKVIGVIFLSKDKIRPPPKRGGRKGCNPNHCFSRKCTEGKRAKYERQKVPGKTN